MSREPLDAACRRETDAALQLHDLAHAYTDHDITLSQFLDAAYLYGTARLERERQQDELWASEP